MTLRAWIDRLTGRRRAVETPGAAVPDPHNPPLPELTPEEEAARAKEQRKQLDKQDRDDAGGEGDRGDDRYVTP